MKFRPLHDRVVVRRLNSEEKTKGGIIIPDTAKEKPQEGTVVAVGPGRWDEDGEKRIPLDVAEGDTVRVEARDGELAEFLMRRHIAVARANIEARVNPSREPSRETPAIPARSA